MTDAHCHLAADEKTRHFICCEPTEDAAFFSSSRDLLFLGIHPWQTLDCPNPDEFISTRLQPFLNSLAYEFAAQQGPTGIGEIGLDRLKCRDISPLMRQVFESQLAFAAANQKPVVLHGAKCWGQVVAACEKFADRIPRFLFHGFSRSDGLIPNIIRLNGFVSVGPAILNDHAVNYHKLIQALPLDRILLETDRTSSSAANLPRIEEIAAKVAELRGMTTAALSAAVEQNADIWFA